MDHQLEDDAKRESNEVDKTIQWARESIQRRRSELAEKKKSLVAKYKEDLAVGNSGNSSSSTTTDVHSMLERGRALLASAEAHSAILGQYASSGKTEGVRPHDEAESDQNEDIIESVHQAEDDNIENAGESTANSPQQRIPDLPVEAPDWEDSCVENDWQPSEDDGNEELQELLREGEARARLDELSATVRRQGDDLPKHDAEIDETPTKRISSFDPSQLSAAKRAAIKRIQWEEEIAAAEEEARLLTSFKALPLPGGAEVKSNLFGSTHAFQGKQIGSVQKLVRRDSMCNQLNDTSSSVLSTWGGASSFDGMSLATSRTSHNDSFSFSAYENEADRERAKQLRAEKKMKKRQLLDAVNQRIMEDDTVQSSAEIDDAFTVYTEGGTCIIEDPSKLRQDIAKLQAKLKQKKTQRLATLNDIVDIDLNALFDRLHSGESGDDMKHIIDRLKSQVCGSVNDFHIMLPPAGSAKQNGFEMSPPKRQSLYRRQEEWAKQRERKLFDARIHLEAEAMDGITGRPELSQASRSWRKAKESHDENLLKFAEEEERKHREKEAKEKAEDEIRIKEQAELQRQEKTVKREQVNKEEQSKRLEQLSQPRQIREKSINLDSMSEMAVCSEHQPAQTSVAKIFLTPKRKSSDDDVRYKPKERALAKKAFDVISSDQKKAEEFCGMNSFSEMTDKEFSKLVRRISRNAKEMVKERSQIEILGNPESLAADDERGGAVVT